MSHKLEKDWHQNVVAGRWLKAYHAFLQRMRVANGLKGMFEYASHPARKSVLVPALLRHMMVDPIDYGTESGDWTLSQGVAFQISLGGSGYQGLERRVFERCVKKLWQRKTQVWVESRGELPFEGILGFIRDKLNGDDREFEESETYGPVSMVGISICETLWVRSDSKGRDFDELLGKRLDLGWAESLKDEILLEFRGCVEEIVDDFAVDTTHALVLLTPNDD